MRIICRPETVEINLMDYETKEMDETVVNIDAWYDRHTKDWCIQLFNKDGYQIGDAYREGTKDGKDYLVSILKEEYGL